MNFNEIKNDYSNKYTLCERLGKLYIEENNKIIDIPCNKWECKLCRPKLQYLLYEEILNYVYIFNLQKHFVITFEGKEYRQKYTIEESYKFMNKQWHKFLNVINYHYGKIIYILLPRAQKDGYCHFHILTNKYLDWKFLNEKRKKYNLGYVSIQKNKDVAEYLNTDFFKKHEWYIPKGIRHYRSSREIILMNYRRNRINKYFTNKMTIEQIKNWIEQNKGITQDIESYYIQKLINKLTDKQGTKRIDYYDKNNYKDDITKIDEIKERLKEEIKEEEMLKKEILNEYLVYN